MFFQRPDCLFSSRHTAQRRCSCSCSPWGWTTHTSVREEEMRGRRRRGWHGGAGGGEREGEREREKRRNLQIVSVVPFVSQTLSLFQKRMSFDTMSCLSESVTHLWLCQHTLGIYPILLPISLVICPPFPTQLPSDSVYVCVYQSIPHGCAHVWWIILQLKVIKIYAYTKILWSTTSSNIFWILKIRKRKLHIAREVININSRSYCLFLENTLISADLLYNLNLHLHGFPMIKIVYDHRFFFFNSGKDNKERRKKYSSTENLKKF